MLDRIIKGALSHRILVIVASIVLFAAGLQTARQTEVDVFPDLNAPTVVVMSADSPTRRAPVWPTTLATASGETSRPRSMMGNP